MADEQTQGAAATEEETAKPANPSDDHANHKEKVESCEYC